MTKFDPKNVKNVEKIEDVPFFNIGDGNAKPNIAKGESLHLELLGLDESGDDPTLNFKVLETEEEFKTTSKLLIDRAARVLENGVYMKVTYNGLVPTKKGGNRYHDFTCSSFDL